MSQSTASIDKTYKLLIGGQWVVGDEGTCAVVNPATEEIVAGSGEEAGGLQR